MFTYVATSNPYQAKAILHKYGYSTLDVNTERDLGACLKQLVAYEGEDALHDVINSHPDKGLLSEIYGTKAKTSEGESCDCKHCKERRGMHDYGYMNFTGNSDAQSKSTKEVSIFIIASALLLASAILVRK